MKTRGKIVVYVPMVGDLFHIGHRRLLKFAKGLGNWLIVGVIPDEDVGSYKRKPVIPFDERVEILSDYADEIVTQEGQDPTEDLKSIQPDILVHGDDWAEDYPAFKYMRSIGKKVIRTKYYPYQSTTMIIDKIISQYMEE